MKWILGEPAEDLSVSFFLRLWGVMVAAVAINLIHWDYDLARHADAFNLPLIPALSAVPPWLHATLVFGLLVPGALMMADRAATAGAAAASLLMAYFLAFDRMAFHHGWVLVSEVGGLLALMSAGRREGREVWGAAGLRCARLATVVLYLSAGANKLNGGFLEGQVVTALVRQHGGVGAALLHAAPGMAPVFATGAAAMELAVGLGLMVAVLRPWAVGIAVALHLGIYWTTSAGQLFHVIMPACLVFFVWDRVPHRTLIHPRGWRHASLLRRIDILEAWTLKASDVERPRVSEELGVAWWRAVGSTVPLANPLVWIFGLMTILTVMRWLTDPG